MRWRTVLLSAGLCMALLSGAAPGAQMPRVAAFLYQDSLAVTVDCAPLLTEQRTEELREGYPLSFILELDLVRHDPIWFDTSLDHREARFRIVYQKMSQDYRFQIRDFAGEEAVLTLARMPDVAIELEERLAATIAAVRELDPGQRYYFTLALEVRNLTFEDVQSAERWLREGEAQADSVRDGSGRTLGEQALGWLWELAGLKGERREAATDKFRLRQLRRVE